MTYTDPISTAAVDYLQRLQMTPDLRGGANGTSLGDRRVVRVTGVGRTERREPRRMEDLVVEPPTLPLFVGLAGIGAPIAFLLESDGSNVSARMGTWATRERPDADGRQALLVGILGGVYPAIDLAPAGVATPRLGHGTLALGVPEPTTMDPRDGAFPIDRLIRSLSGLRWAALVLATPVSGDELRWNRNGVLNEMRAVTTAAHTTGMRSPLAEQYLTLLEGQLKAINDAQARGGWRTAVYLLGARAHDMEALGSAWRAVFSGTRSIPEPVHTVAHPAVAGLAAQWAMPEGPEPAGPGNYRHPYAGQTLLSSAQLAAYVHLPALETAGFGIRTVPRFDVLSPPASEPKAVVGAVVERDRPGAASFAVPLDSLTRHAFVAGVTGSGKSNSVLHLIRQAAAAGIPFLVVEPAKAEYRSLLRDPAIGPRLRVFTLGRETVSPLRLNPFELPEGVTVAEHLDLLRVVFEGAFGMWTPLPQVLERCLHELYDDRGWDLRTGTNHRLDPRAPDWAAFPTLTDLMTKVPAVSRSLGYEEKIAADIEAALTTRVASLRMGGKGALLDVQRSFPIADLLAEPTVLELEGMGSDDDKAFIMGLLLVRLASYRRAQGQQPGLRHLFVVEEAHRLLSAAPAVREENVADPRGHAVQTFANLLAEIRAYGQGTVIADQVPNRLAPDVMKNTQLKLAHRTVAADDRESLATTMNMNEEQSAALVSLEVGRAAVFGYGADAPVLVQVPPAKDDELVRATDDEAVRAAMANWRAAHHDETLWLAAPTCTPTCVESPRACEAARTLLDDVLTRETFTRVVLSLLADGASLDRTWPDLVQVIRQRRAPHVDDLALQRCVAAHAPDRYAARRGAQAGWSYADTLDYAERLRNALLAAADARPSAVEAFRGFALALHECDVLPYPRCGQICPEHTCLYRGPVADLVQEGRYQLSWNDADASDRAAGTREATRGVCDLAAYELLEYPPDDATPELTARINGSRRRAGLCFAQQMLAADRHELPRSTRGIIDNLLAATE
ncbi:DUF87 domain-containing protein [Nonomuraea wenchangensis]